MRIWKPVYILVEKWRLEFYCHWFGVELMYKAESFDTECYETGIKLAWWPVRKKIEGCSRFVYHWQELVRTTREAVEDGHRIRTTP